MRAFIYNSALLCEDCGENTRREIEGEAINAYRETHPRAVIDVSDPDDVGKCLGFDPDFESDYDSDQYPKGPYAYGGGEADTPQHCDACRVFLENGLTGDGQTYVIERLIAYMLQGDGDRDVLMTWWEFYGASISNAALGDELRYELSNIGLPRTHAQR